MRRGRETEQHLREAHHCRDGAGEGKRRIGNMGDISMLQVAVARLHQSSQMLALKCLRIRPKIWPGSAQLQDR